MIKVSQKCLEDMERKLYKCGLCATISIIPVLLPNTELECKKEVFYMYHNKNIIVRIYSIRNKNDVWCEPVKIEYENTLNQNVVTYYCY